MIRTTTFYTYHFITTHRYNFTTNGIILQETNRIKSQNERLAPQERGRFKTKQHITIDQLWELCPDKNDWNPIIKFNTKANIYFPEGIRRDTTFQSCCKTTCEQVTIGKMIELLFQHHDSLVNHPQMIRNALDEWCFYITVYGQDILVCYADELADCLWEALKKIL
jgi:hypothetical protein